MCVEEADEDSLEEEEEEVRSMEGEGEAEASLIMTPSVEEHSSRTLLSQSFSTNAGSVDYSGDELDPATSELVLLYRLVVSLNTMVISSIAI